MAGEQDRGTLPPPYCLAMVVCDAIWHDPGSGKRTIPGVFSTIFAPGFPVTHPLLAVYVATTNGRGKVTLALELVGVNDDGDESTLVRAEAPVDFPDPRAILEGDFYMQGIVFPKEGEYRLQLFADQEFLLERRLVVMQVPGAKS